jgi:MoaA/NifB/PqqE/SkfB family radical SAM enzyme
MGVTVESCGPTGQRILQIHPTLRCNLQCEHCYSSSGPWAREELDRDVVYNVLSDAARMGYQVLSVSGGEPFLYRGLSDVLRRAHELGMRTTVTTNGYFLDPRHIEPLLDCLDVLAISLDGPPEIHNRIRASPLAFDRLCAGLEHLRASALNFGFIHTLTRESWIHLLWLADFAAENGARLLQLHPLELAGRAEQSLKEFAPADDVLSKVYLLSVALAGKYSGVMTIQTDLLHREQILADPELVYAGAAKDDWEHAVPALLLGVVVLEPDGAVVPLTYGFSRRYRICNAKEQTLVAAWPDFLQDTYPSLWRLCHDVFEELVAPGAQPLFNWHEQIAAHSHHVVPATVNCGRKS